MKNNSLSRVDICRHRLLGLLSLTLSLTLGLATGCSNSADKGDAVKDTTIKRPNDIGDNVVPTDSNTNNALGSANVGLDIKLVELTGPDIVDFTYRNGRESGNNAILESLGGGVALLDFDNDGLLDIFLPGGGTYEGKNVRGLSAGLFRNLGEMKFVEVTDLAGTTPDGLYSHGAQIGDFDNDGFSDVLVTGYGSLQLFHNQGDGTFLEVHEAAHLTSRSWSSSAAWGDFNGDSFLDLYVCNYVSWSFDNHPTCPGPEPGQIEICPPKSFEGLADTLYFNNGDGTFRDVSKESGIHLEDKISDAKGLGVLVGDVDRDNDVDIYVANDTEANFLYLNNGNGTFKELGLLHSVATWVTTTVTWNPTCGSRITSRSPLPSMRTVAADASCMSATRPASPAWAACLLASARSSGTSIWTAMRTWWWPMAMSSSTRHPNESISCRCC